MRLSILAPLLIVPAAFAQNATTNSTSGNPGAYLQAVLGALTGAGLTSLVGVASSIANTSEGMALLGQLAQGNKTVFAPSNAAFSNVSQEVSSNTTLLTQILSYHILNNTYTANGTRIAPNHTIARTLLRGGGYSLPGNRSAPLVLSRNSTNATSFQINQATLNTSAMGPAVAANLNVYVIDSVLELPPTVGEIATSLFPSLAGVIQQTGLLDPLAASSGLTIFAPNDAAVAGIQSSLGQLNSTQISTILANHVVNGTVAYSDRLSTSNYTSAAGQPFRFMSNSSGTYVMSANSTAKVVQSDIIIANGVVHLIDGVLINTQANPSAASAAYSSGIAAAATQTEGTAPVTATSAANTAGGSSSASSTSRAAALGQFDGLVGSSASMVGMAVGAVGVMLGGGFVLI